MLLIYLCQPPCPAQSQERKKTFIYEKKVELKKLGKEKFVTYKLSNYSTSAAIVHCHSRDKKNGLRD